MPITTDFHNHVSYTSALHMAEAAKNKGLRVFGLSEHIFQMSEARPLLSHMAQEGPLQTFAEYMTAVRSAGQKLNLDIRLSMEVDFIPNKNAAIQQAISSYDWDFLIGSVHQIDDDQFENTSHSNRQQGELLWLRYFQLLREAVRSGYFSLISHPVRMRTQNPYLPATFDEELEHLAAEATHYNIALELNGYDILTYPSLVRRLARACASQATPISIGSDAHYPQRIAQTHAQMEAIMREVGITKVRIWKQRQIEEYSI